VIGRLTLLHLLGVKNFITIKTGQGGGGIGDIVAQSVTVADELEGTEEDM
jgi:hypothetical protein